MRMFSCVSGHAFTSLLRFEDHEPLDEYVMIGVSILSPPFVIYSVVVVGLTIASLHFSQ